MEIDIVTSTKDLIGANRPSTKENYACLVGNPSYDEDRSKIKEILRERRKYSQEVFSPPSLVRAGAFGQLPGTKIEIENVAAILNQLQWRVDSWTGDLALEESIKATQKPKILHIATHGYFEADASGSLNPLLYSGLIFAGANKSSDAVEDKNLDDGILTAYEAMNLNLDNTDLVVLSACETGLGEIKNGEGVYGLQRAFKVAGARSIIMSLWKVSDDATQELMVSFYKHWLRSSAVGAERQTANGSKAVWPAAPTANSKRAAFLKAQKELKAKYPDPYYWGAFVMVGE